jgi:hypothetical protein
MVPVLVRAVEIQDSKNAVAIRTNAAIILSQIGDPKILLPIARRAVDPQVKAWMLSGLTFNADKTVTETMVESLSDKNPMIRQAAVGGLGLSARQFIPGELPALVKCLQDENPDVRFSAALILSSAGSTGQISDHDYEQLNSSTLAEIKKATNNPDPDVREAALKAIKGQDPISAYVHELAISMAESRGQKWVATVKVVDESGNPISNASATVSYNVPDIQLGGQMETGSRDLKGVTDEHGIFIATHKGPSPSWFHAEREGYYSTYGEHETIMFKDDDPQKWNPTITLVLKKIIHPVPMFVSRVDIAHRERPAFDKPVGFDLTVGDFVSPFGKGTNAQMFFTWHVDYDTNDLSATYGKMRSHGWDGRLIISFPNPGDGIIEFDSPGRLNNRLSEGNIGSELRLPQLAPDKGYQSQLLKTNRWHFGQLGNANDYDHLHKNYIFRVNTVLDEKGNIKSAQYGKIHGDFEEALTTYLNPELNSHELEYDMKHNLGQGGNNFYITP